MVTETVDSPIGLSTVHWRNVLAIVELDCQQSSRAVDSSTIT